MGVLRNIAVDPVTGDFYLIGPSLAMVSDGTAITQAVKSALSLFLGEWYLDTSIGTAWFQNILVKNPDLNAIREIFREQILGVQGITGIVQLNLDYSPGARSLSVSYTATADAGQLISGTVSVPVI